MARRRFVGGFSNLREGKKDIDNYKKLTRGGLRTGGGKISRSRLKRGLTKIRSASSPKETFLLNKKVLEGKSLVSKQGNTGASSGGKVYSSGRMGAGRRRWVRILKKKKGPDRISPDRRRKGRGVT